MEYPAPAFFEAGLPMRWGSMGVMVGLFQQKRRGVRATMRGNETMIAFWKGFLESTNRDPSLEYVDCYYFDNSEDGANQLLKLVLDGTKKATSTSIHFFECRGLPLPQVGDLNVVTDWDGVPHCVIETTRVTVLPFRDMTFDICKREGEDDSLESWQAGHIRFFTQDGETEGYAFSWDMPVVFEDFVVVYPV